MYLNIIYHENLVERGELWKVSWERIGYYELKELENRMRMTGGKKKCNKEQIGRIHGKMVIKTDKWNKKSTVRRDEWDKKNSFEGMSGMKRLWRWINKWGREVNNWVSEAVGRMSGMKMD